MAVTGAARNTILLKAHPGEVPDEGVVKAAKTVTPGMLVESTADAPDSYNRFKWQPQATAGASCSRVVALENNFVGDGVDDDYAAGDLVFLHKCQPGDRINVRLAAGESVQPDDYLTGDGAGALKRIGTGNATDAKLFKAAEVVDNSAGSTPVLCMADSL